MAQLLGILAPVTTPSRRNRLTDGRHGTLAHPVVLKQGNASSTA